MNKINTCKTKFKNVVPPPRCTPETITYLGHFLIHLSATKVLNVVKENRNTKSTHRTNSPVQPKMGGDLKSWRPTVLVNVQNTGEILKQSPPSTQRCQGKCLGKQQVRAFRCQGCATALCQLIQVWGGAHKNTGGCLPKSVPSSP